MNIRAQLVMVFNLDKCIGCHACSISCKNIWTDRKGAEYMWWNNLETKPGVGYPEHWENQEKFKGGWLREGGKLKLRALGKLPTLFNMFFQPNMPKLDDYYEPFDFDYSNLYKAPPGSDQPVAEAFSQISGKRMEEIRAAPTGMTISPVHRYTQPTTQTCRTALLLRITAACSCSTCPVSATTV